jgi:hypothetical protein
MTDYKELIERLLRLDSHPESAPKQAADALQAVNAKYEAVISERPYIVGWNDGFDYAEHTDETRSVPDVVEVMAKKLAAEQCVEVKPLDFPERRNGYWGHKHGYQIAHTAGETFRVRLGGKVICKHVNGFDRAVAWANNHHVCTILSALNTPRPASEVRAEGYAEGFAAGIEAAKIKVDEENNRRIGLSSLRIPALADELQSTLDTLHTPDSQAAIERIKREERERIEELEAANRGLVRLNEATHARAESAVAKLAKAVKALVKIINVPSRMSDADEMERIARAALAELTTQTEDKW